MRNGERWHRAGIGAFVAQVLCKLASPSHGDRRAVEAAGKSCDVSALQRFVVERQRRNGFALGPLRRS